jgi:hypothetical protein
MRPKHLPLSMNQVYGLQLSTDGGCDISTADRFHFDNSCDLKHIFFGIKHIFARPEWRADGSRPASYGNSTLTEMERVSMSDSAIYHAI